MPARRCRSSEPVSAADTENRRCNSATIGRTIHFFKQDAKLVVNCAPFGCMPGQTITGILNEVERDYSRPVLSLFYEGTGDLNSRIGVFLKNLPREGAGDPVARA